MARSKFEKGESEIAYRIVKSNEIKGIGQGNSRGRNGIKIDAGVTDEERPCHWEDICEHNGVI